MTEQIQNRQGVKWKLWVVDLLIELLYNNDDDSEKDKWWIKYSMARASHVGPLNLDQTQPYDLLIRYTSYISKIFKNPSLRWRYNERDGVSNHQPYDCFLNLLSRRRSKKTSKLRITTAHAFPYRVASMPAVRYDLSGGLPTCLWLFIYQDYSVICISKKLM